MQEITEKIKNNAMASYWMIVANITFLFSKDPNINNDFVKNHTKTAILIHLWILINSIVFVFYWLWIKYNIAYYHLSDVIAIFIYLVLFALLWIWVYKAYKGETFKISETMNLKKDFKILDISNNWVFSEKDKLTIILSLVPFVWLIIFPKYQKNKLIINNIKINLIVTTILLSLYIFWNTNLSNILFLAYIIFIVFYWIYIFSKNEVININLSFFPTWKELNLWLLSLKKYFANYFKNKDFKDFKDIYKDVELEKEQKYKIELKKLFNKKDFKLNKYIIYIPLLNFITLFDLNSKKQKHILNWVLISITLIILFVLWYFNILSYKLILFLLIPLFLGIWYLSAWIINYEIPVLYSIINFGTSFKKLFKKTKQIKNKETHLNLKVK